MTDLLHVFPSAGFLHSDGGIPAPTFREFCSVRPAAVGRPIETLKTPGERL